MTAWTCVLVLAGLGESLALLSPLGPETHSFRKDERHKPHKDEVLRSGQKRSVKHGFPGTGLEKLGFQRTDQFGHDQFVPD